MHSALDVGHFVDPGGIGLVGHQFIGRRGVDAGKDERGVREQLPPVLEGKDHSDIVGCHDEVDFLMGVFSFEEFVGEAEVFLRGVVFPVEIFDVKYRVGAGIAQPGNYPVRLFVRPRQTLVVRVEDQHCRRGGGLFGRRGLKAGEAGEYGDEQQFHGQGTTPLSEVAAWR